MMGQVNLPLTNRILLILIFFNINISSASELEKKDTLYLSHKGKDIVVIEGVYNNFFDLYLNIYDSILSYKSTDDNEFYIDINVKIDFNPIKNKFIVIWRTERGGIFQYIEIDNLRFGNGNYYYCFSNTICSGFIERGMKNGLETTIQENSLWHSNYENGYQSGEEIIFYLKTGDIEERFYDNNKLLNFKISYKYTGETLSKTAKKEAQETFKQGKKTMKEEIAKDLRTNGAGRRQANKLANKSIKKMEDMIDNGAFPKAIHVKVGTEASKVVVSGVGSGVLENYKQPEEKK